MGKSPLYVPGQKEPFKMSRSKIEEFIRCPRCFVLEARHGIKKPGGVPFTLNVAVDNQLKKEFDIYRKNKEVHPLVAAAGLDLVPFSHPDLDVWRSNFKGVSHTTSDERFHIFGAVDDLWVNSAGVITVVDYKATGRQEPVTALGTGGFYDGYRRQLEIYQWLLRKNGFEVSDTGYWVYVTATQKQDRFDNLLHFEANLVSYTGNSDWVDAKLEDIYENLNAYQIPKPSDDCDVCLFFEKRATFFQNEEEDVTWPTCENCGRRMHKVIYGYPIGPPSDGYLLGGCTVESPSPNEICLTCNPPQDEEQAFSN